MEISYLRTMELKVKYAGHWPRLLAINIDLTLLLPVYYLCTYIVGTGIPLWPFLLIMTILYEAVFTSTLQCTPGKRISKIKIICTEGQLPVKTAIVRSLLKVPSAALFIISWPIMILHPQKRTIHDLLSNTFVIFAETE